MSEENVANIIVALITAMGSIIGGYLGARATIIAADRKANTNQTSLNNNKKNFPWGGVLGGAFLGAALTLTILFLLGVFPSGITKTPLVTETPVIVSAATPQLLETLIIPSNSDNGVVYFIRKSGAYTFEYSPNTSAFWNGANWANQLVVFKGNTPEWANSYNLNYDTALFALGSSGYESKELAIDGTRNQKGVAFLNAGDFITLIVGDERYTYSDNIGDITIDIIFEP